MVKLASTRSTLLATSSGTRLAGLVGCSCSDPELVGDGAGIVHVQAGELLGLAIDEAERRVAVEGRDTQDAGLADIVEAVCLGEAGEGGKGECGAVRAVSFFMNIQLLRRALARMAGLRSSVGAIASGWEASPFAGGVARWRGDSGRG